MPWIDLLAVAAAAFAIVAAAQPRTSRTLLLTSAAIAASFLVLGFALEGARWQLVALALLAVVLLPVAAWAGRRRGAAPRRVVGAGALVAALGIGAASWVLPPASIPQPTGTFAVGVASDLRTDASRNARGGGPDGTVRSLPMTIWYPSADTGADPAPLIADEAATTVDGLASQYGLPSWVLQQLRAAKGHAAADAPALDGGFPVVLFSPGLESSRWLAASWATELASHGVVVIALDHPHDAAAVRTADGTIARSELVATGDEAEGARLAEQWTRTRADDLAALLDQLSSDRSGIPALAGADFSRVVAAGHSRGGAAALLLAETDPRVAGAIDIDGMPPSQILSRGIPTVILRAGDAEPNPAYDAATSAFVRAGATRVTIDGVAHIGFTDVAFIIGPIPGVVGSAAQTGPARAAAATRAVVDAVALERPLDLTRLAELGSIG